MRTSADMVIHGEISPSLLRNLEEFQDAWHCWLPEQYRKINITADVEKESSKHTIPLAIMAFSGGSIPVLPRGVIKLDNVAVYVEIYRLAYWFMVLTFHWMIISDSNILEKNL